MWCEADERPVWLLQPQMDSLEVSSVDVVGILKSRERRLNRSKYRS